MYVAPFSETSRIGKASRSVSMPESLKYSIPMVTLELRLASWCLEKVKELAISEVPLLKMQRAFVFHRQDSWNKF